MYHGHTWFPRHDTAGHAFMWTVDWNDRGFGGRNQRRLLICRNGVQYHTGVRYPTIPVGPDEIIGQRRMVDPRWAPGSAPDWVFTDLYTQGYLSYTGFEPILNTPLGIPRSEHYYPPAYDIDPRAIQDDFRDSGTNARQHWPDDATRMVGYGDDQRLHRATPWHSPFLISRTTGRFVRRPVTELPNFPSGTPRRPLHPHIVPPPPPPAPVVQPTFIGPLLPHPTFIGPLLPRPTLIRPAPAPTTAPPSAVPVNTIIMEGPQPSPKPPRPPKRPPGPGGLPWLVPLPGTPGSHVDEGAIVEGLNSTSNVTSLASTS